jgi:alkylated DNA repair dioxygenase AlkB
MGLFDADLPDGFRYQKDFVPPEAADRLVQQIAGLTFGAFEMRGVVARRRVAFFGEAYDATRPAAAMPGFLIELRDRAAAWAGLPGPAFVMALVNEYRPGAPIGWHRDAPQYGVIVGISLLSACRLRLRPYVAPRAHAAAGAPRRTASHELELAPRSVYQIAGAARSAYEHSIPAVDALRYSVTFRTRRTEGRRG